MALIRARTLFIEFRGETRGLERTIRSIGQATTPLQKLERAGKAAFTTLALGGAAVAGGLAFSVKAFADFDAALNESIAIMGDVTDMQRNEMAAAAREVATQTTFSAEQAASAFYYLASSGLSAEQSIEALPQVAQFAQAGLFDLETATDLLVNSQIAMGLSSKDAEENLRQLTRVSDVLTEANNEATGSVQEFAEALTNKAAGAMRDAKVELEEGVAVLAALAQKGLKGASAGEKLAIFLRDTTRAAVRNREEFAKFNVEIFDQNGELKNLADVVAEFENALGPMSTAERAAALESMGMTRAVGDVIRTLMGSSDEIRTYEQNLRNAGGATEEVADKQLQTFNAQMTLLKNKLMDVAIEIGSRLVPLLMPLVEWLQESLPGAIEYAKELWQSFKPVLKTVASFIEDFVIPPLKEFAELLRDHPALVAALGSAILAVLVALSVAFVGFKVVAVAQMALVGAKMLWLGAQALIMGARMLIAWIIGLGPIALVVLAVIALGVVIYLFREQIVQWLGTAWEFIRDKAETAWNFIKDHITKVLLLLGAPIALFVAFVVTQWTHIWAFVVHVFHVLKEVAEDFWFFLQGVWNLITIAVVFAWHVIAGAARAAWNFIMDKTEGARQWIGDRMVWVRDKIGGVWDWVKEKVGGVWDWIKDKIKGVVDWIGDQVDRVKGFVGDIVDALGSIPGAGVLGDTVGFLTGNQMGGVVPKRYQMGGIAGDTVPILAKPGEMVLNRRQQTALFQSLNRGGFGGGGGGDTYVVEIYRPIGSEEEFTRMVVNAIKRAGGQGRPITIRGRQL